MHYVGVAHPEETSQLPRTGPGQERQQRGRPELPDGPACEYRSG